MASEIKWIKLSTDMFDDEKIDFISSLPESDAIIVIWIRLLALAGKCNAGGYIFLTEKIPYTEEMLAHKFKKPLNIVKLALDTFRRLDMIDMDNSIIFLPNWEKHQNIEGMERIRQQTKERVQRHREKKRELLPPSNVTVTPEVTPSNATDIDIEKELQEEKEKPMTAMEAYYFAFKKYSYTGYISGYITELMNRGFTDAFIREIFLEMGARGINPDVNYMRKMAEDWISKGIYTRVEAERRKVVKLPVSEREAQLQQKASEERESAPEISYEPYDEFLRRTGSEL